MSTYWPLTMVLPTGPGHWAALWQGSRLHALEVAGSFVQLEDAAGNNGEFS